MSEEHANEVEEQPVAADTPPQIQMAPRPLVVDGQYLASVEAKLIAELETAEKQLSAQLEAARVNNALAMRVVQLARIGLFASQESSAKVEGNENE